MSFLPVSNPFFTADKVLYALLDRHMLCPWDVVRGRALIREDIEE